MNKFKINKLNPVFDINSLLNKYSESLSKDTGGELYCEITCSIKNNIYYDFGIVYYNECSRKTHNLFTIALLDVDGNLELVVYYRNNNLGRYSLHFNELEQKLDEIIDTKKIGDLIGYIFLINSLSKLEI